MIRTALFGLLATTVLTTTAVADRYNRWVTIINDTGLTMREFYASNTDARSWQEDILGRDVLPAGYQVDVNVDDGTGYCMYDVKAVFEDGSETVDRVNVCETGVWRVY